METHFLCQASLIFLLNRIHGSPWKYFPLSQLALRGTLRNVRGERGEGSVRKVGEKNTLIDFPIMTWNSIFIDCLWGRGGWRVKVTEEWCDVSKFPQLCWKVSAVTLWNKETSNVSKKNLHLLVVDQYHVIPDGKKQGRYLKRFGLVLGRCVWVCVCVLVGRQLCRCMTDQTAHWGYFSSSRCTLKSMGIKNILRNNKNIFYSHSLQPSNPQQAKLLHHKVGCDSDKF